MTASPLTYAPEQLLILKDHVKCTSLVCKQINSFDRYNQFFATQTDLLLSPKKNADDTIKKKIKKTYRDL